MNHHHHTMEHHQHQHEHEHEPVQSHQDHGMQHGGHSDHEHHGQDFLKRFWISIIVTIPLLLLSHSIQQWFGFNLYFNGDNYILLLLGSFIYIYGGKPFLVGAISEIKRNAIGMMTLVAIAITVAYLYSTAVMLGFQGMDFFWELATLIDIMLLGHWIEMRSQMKASGALESLVALLPDSVHLEEHGHVKDVSISQIKNNDIILIKPGEKIPADGIVTEGGSYVNESMLTGESTPVRKETGSRLIAGSVNNDGSMRMKVTGSGKESYLNRVIKMVEAAQQTKSKNQKLADRVAKWLTFISIGAGAITFIFWTFYETLPFALERMVTVMVTACPHALGVAIPLVAAISTTASATNGLLIRNRTAFENAGKINVLLFDKTGTLTLGGHSVQHIVSLSESHTDTDVLQFAAAVEQYSEHYIGRGILEKLKEKELELWKVENFEYKQGIGVSGKVRGVEVMVVGENHFKTNNTALPELPGQIDQKRETVSYVLVNNELIGIITLADSIRETSAEAIDSLKKMNIRSYLITGDNEQIASSVSKTLNMDGYFAGVLPHQKQNILKKFQSEGKVVAMTGDGVNDAPALAQADVGIAVGSGTDVAAETADIILANSDPLDVVQVIKFGDATYKKMIQNLVWATGYNVVAIPLAAGLLYPGFILSPALGAVLMSLSTVIVAFNARLLKLKK